MVQYVMLVMEIIMVVNEDHLHQIHSWRLCLENSVTTE